MATKDYDPKAVTLNFGGHIAGGFAKGTFITVDRANDTWTQKVGASGESARSKSNDKSGTIEVVLMQTSLTNDYLSAQHALDEGPASSGKFPVGLVDRNGTTIIGGVEGWVQKPPSTEYSDELSDRTWTIAIGELLMYVGGTE
jgi:hypothetical protein